LAVIATLSKGYDLLFGDHKAPDGTPPGRSPGSGRKVADIYARLLSAEPHATAERKRELLLEATRQARQSPLFFDLTLSPRSSRCWGWHRWTCAARRC
jgi:hypothetical protein